VPTEVIMPMLGMNQDTGKVVRWLRAEGDSVAKGDPLFEVETDKVTVEIEAPAAGTLHGISAAEGEDVPVGRAIAFLLAEGESGDPESQSPRSPTADRALVRPRRSLASPKARRLASEQGIEIDRLSGSGPNGAVVAADVERHADAVASALPDESAGTVFEVGSVWRVMAERTQQSWQEVPHFFLSCEVDATRLDGWRATVRQRPSAPVVTHTDLLVRLVAAALQEHPRVNASWRDGTIAANERVNIGIAVAVDEGLVVPVIADADQLELLEIAGRRAELVAAARARRLKPADVDGGTFTISNLGIFRVDAFVAIVNAPQAAILSVGRIAQRAVVVDGTIVARPTLVLGLSFDHRVVDGAAGARFLDTLAALVEEPASLIR
jgi:pyruvate dehydrogenase E2 component (dihydrolipoamide acetyltransferase)